MKEISKKVFSVLLVIAILMSPYAAFNALADESTDIQLEIQVSSNKSTYSLFDNPHITITIENKGTKAVSNIVAFAVSDDLKLINNGSLSSKYIFNIAPGATEEFSFDVVLSRNSTKVNIFYKILLFFKTLFMSLSNLEYYTVNEPIASSQATVSFGAIQARLSVQIEQNDPDTISDAELAEMKKVDKEINKLLNNNEFESYTETEKQNAVTDLLENFENTQVANDSISYDENSKMCSFSYANGVLGGVYLGDFPENSNGLNDSEQNITAPIAENAVNLSDKDALILFSFNFSTDNPSFRDPFYTQTEKSWEATGLNTDVDKSVTVRDIKNIDSDYEIICFSGHGVVYRNVPSLCLTEVRTDSKDKEYAYDLKNNNLAIVSYGSDPDNFYYLVFPTLFESTYGSNGLNGKFIFSETCCFLGEFGRYNYSLADTLVECGAEAVVGFHNSVMAVYSRDFMKYWVDNLCAGKTAEQAYNLSVNKYGTDDGQSLNAAVPKLTGKKSSTLVKTTYTVSYNANGGTGAPASQTKTKDINLTLSSTKPERSGYTFVGWAESSSATSAAYSAGGQYTKNASATLYAVWKKDTVATYTITYNANGGVGAPPKQTKTHGVSLTLSSTEPTRDGYRFLGWSHYGGATSPTYNPGDTYTANSSATLYAVWKKIEITLSSYSGSGTQKASSANIYTLSNWVQGDKPADFTFGTYKGFRVKLPEVTSNNTPGYGVAGWTVYSGNCVIADDYMYISQPGTVKVRYYSKGYYSDVYTYTLSLEKDTTAINYIRSSASSSATKLGSVPANKTVSISSINWNGTYTKDGTTYPAAWGKVTYGGKTGYIILWYTHSA